LTSAFATQLQHVLDVDVQDVLRAARQVAESPVSQLRSGAKVRLIGLFSRPELNGQVGVVTEPCAQKKGDEEQRWGVSLLSGAVVSVKKSNMVITCSHPCHMRRRVCAYMLRVSRFSLKQQLPTIGRCFSTLCTASKPPLTSSIAPLCQ
jgi:hypothetical protein